MDSHLIHERQSTSSTVSMMEPQDRLDALQRTNNDLNRKLREAEATLQTRLNEHDSEIEELQARIDELNAELGATKREEKELRIKEVRLPPFFLCNELRLTGCLPSSAKAPPK
jgi:predicted RNase H-like nuclease (RuvC/YqgF family)